MEGKMKYKNRSAGATLGAAFLFLSFTAVPVSLRAVGLDVHFSPSVNAVIDVWAEIAGAFQAGSQPVTTSELVALNDRDAAAPSLAPDASPESDCQLARNSDVTDFETAEALAEQTVSSTALKAQTETRRARRAKPVEQSLLGGRPLAFASLRVATFGDLEFRPIEIAHDLKDLAINREALLKDFKKRTIKYTYQMRESLRLARASKDFKLMVEVGKPLPAMRPAPSSKLPCPSSRDIAPKVREVRMFGSPDPQAETGEI
jgi:hypothetical protein